jgi:SAM-dependent methyltransferase
VGKAEASNLDSRIWDVLERYGVRADTNPGLAWSQELRQQQKVLWRESLRRLIRRLTGRESRRGQIRILAEYDRQWKKKGFEKYRPTPTAGGNPWVWKDFRFWLSNEAGAAVRLLYLEDALARTDARAVLEVGCGNGINLHLLAARFPNIQFCGLEATAQGCAAAAGVRSEGRLPDDLKAFAPFEIREECAVGDVQIVRGSGRRLPFPDASFDLVMTSLALEQMEEIRDSALSEISRVASRYVVMLEPFRDVNRRGLRRAYVRAYDYFEGAIADLGNYGLKVLSVTTDMPHKARLGTALVTARRVNSHETDAGDSLEHHTSS